jgi:hypothetical protein
MYPQKSLIKKQQELNVSALVGVVTIGVRKIIFSCFIPPTGRGAVG